MEPTAARRIVNGSIWIVCGVLVILIRALIIQSSSLIYWEILGAAMILYGTSRMARARVKGVPDAAKAL